MDYSLFCSVLRNLLHLNVYAGELDEAYLRGFEEKYCYHAALQPLFRAETMRPLLGEIEGVGETRCLLSAAGAVVRRS